MASKRAKAALASGLGLVALTATYLTAPWEGMENHAYYDRLGRVWTVCLGETRGVKKGDYYTDRQCREKLIARLENDFRQPLRKCIRTFDRAPISVQAAMLDLSYNIGAGAACKSTAARRMNDGQWRLACNAMAAFNRAGGKVIEGLRKRREMGDAKRIGELEICLAGL
ncbi:MULTISPECIES: lysozyme [unclassified Brucella]|uniref:lysozyme n=1 Tax=unclassified Brucella TaxID=2632610 RepID=UPI00217CF9CE|nr:MULTISPECIES: lysozyme [unclassified Brucella]UWF67382.1 lysozyme [Brucella sp. 1315]UWF70507.1 lysozyme [Brucella sp. 2594]